MPATGGNRVAKRGVGIQRNRYAVVVTSSNMNERKGRGWVLHHLPQLIANQPGQTQLELTRAIYGPDALHSRLSVQIGRLIRDGAIRREGAGGGKNPYRYFPATQN